MEFVRVPAPDPGNDTAIACSSNGISCQIQAAAVPALKTVNAIETADPILPLSQNLLKNPDHTMKSMTFPLLVDLFHRSIIRSETKPPRCTKCRAFITNGECPFCTNNFSEMSCVSWARSTVQKPVFVFLVVGNTTELFYSGLRNFPHPMILLRYDGSFVFYRVERGHFREYHMIEECALGSSAVMREIGEVSIPEFPPSTLSKIDLKNIVGQVISMLPETNSAFHVIVISSLPHTCLEGIPEKPNVTVSVLSTNAAFCDCARVCERTGGHFLPHAYSMNIPDMKTVLRHTIKTNDVSIESREASLLYPGQFLVVRGMQSWTKRPFVNVQVVVKTNDAGYCFTFGLKSEVGVKTFMYSMSVPNLLLTERPIEFFTHMLKSCTHTEATLNVPHSLRHFMLFPAYSAQRRAIGSVMTTRPFVVQFKPTLRVPEIVTARLCTTLTVMLVLHYSTIYVWVGADVSRETWMEMIGVENNSKSTSFEIADMPESFTSPLWVSIRSIQGLLYPYRAPVIIVPGESGRRAQIIQILSVDQVDNENTLLNKYGELANACLN